MKEWLGVAMQFIFDTIAFIGTNAMAAVFETLTSVGIPPPQLEQISSVLNGMNYFIPLNELLGMSISLATVWVTVVSFKFIVKFAPFVD